MRLYALLFGIGLVVYGALAYDRVGTQSPAPQFVYQADAWLNGKLSVIPKKTDADWAKLETVERKDTGELVTGRRMITRPFFHPLRGPEIPNAQIGATRGVTWYMSFPAFPTVIMIPSAIISGRDGNDVVPTILLAALILPLSLLVLRRLADAKLSQRTIADDLWLVATLAFGSVMFFSAVQGSVWYTAHVVGVVLALLYAWGSIEAKRPIIAGLALGAAALTRTPMAFMFPLFLFEAWRMAGGDRRVFVRSIVPFVIPVAAFGIAGMTYNLVRFHSPTEFGHTYLDVRQQLQIEHWGLASYHYLTRNLATAFTLLPILPGRAPWVQISGHGLALWFTTPLLLYTLWPREKPAVHRALWITVACVAVPTLFYQNSGWVQFGYRFSLDYMVFLIMLIAIGARRLGWLARGLILAGILINLFGAFTFNRVGKYYHHDYEAVVRH